MLKIIFTSPKKDGIVSWGIKLLTWAPYCHVALHIDDKIFHAVDNGCIWADAPSFYAKNVVKAEFVVRLDATQQQQLIAQCRKVTGKKYDWNSVVGLGLARAAHYLGRPLKSNPFQNHSQTMFCSELGYQILRSLKLVAASAQPELLDPKRLLRLIEKTDHKAIKRTF